jgi:hypothetical protein
MKEPITPLFNQLSLFDRFALKSASLFKAVTGIARDDSKANPWRYPLYAGFLLLIMAPIPLPGANIVPIGIFFLMARTRLTPWARMADDRLTTAFNSEAVMEAHKHLIHPDVKDPARCNMDGIRLAKETARATLDDLYDATRHGWRGMKRSLTWG